jgi:hypothetical protein
VLANDAKGALLATSKQHIPTYFKARRATCKSRSEGRLVGVATHSLEWEETGKYLALIASK